MTTWADVANNAVDALKIIVPATLTALVATLVALFNHLNDRTKEKRNRRLACIEETNKRLIEYIEKTSSLATVLARAHETTGLQHLGTDLVKALKRAKEGQMPFEQLSQLRLFGLDRCVEAVTEVHNATLCAYSAAADGWSTTDRTETLEIVARLECAGKAAFGALHQAYQRVENDGWRTRLRDYFDE